MGFFDGPIFDFNGDGKQDAFETFLGFQMISDCEKESRYFEEEDEDLYEEDEDLYEDDEDDEDDYDDDDDDD